MEGAKYVCSPPPRDKASPEGMWDRPEQTFSSLFLPTTAVPYDTRRQAHNTQLSLGKWHSGVRPAADLFSRASRRAHQPQWTLWPHGDQSRQDLWPLPKRARSGRSDATRDLGPGRAKQIPRRCASRLGYTLIGNCGDRWPVSTWCAQVRVRERQADRREKVAIMCHAQNRPMRRRSEK